MKENEELVSNFKKMADSGVQGVTLKPSMFMASSIPNGAASYPTASTISTTTSDGSASAAGVKGFGKSTIVERENTSSLKADVETRVVGLNCL